MSRFSKSSPFGSTPFYVNNSMKMRCYGVLLLIPGFWLLKPIRLGAKMLGLGGMGAPGVMGENPSSLLDNRHPPINVPVIRAPTLRRGRDVTPLSERVCIILALHQRSDFLGKRFITDNFVLLGSPEEDF